MVLSATAALLASAAAFGTSTAQAAESRIDMGEAKSYAVVGGVTVTNTGPSVISGDVGVSPSPAITGFPPAVVTNGVIHAGDAEAASAQAALTTAYNDAAGRSTTMDITGQDLAGMNLKGGVYTHTSAMPLNGVLTLDGENNPNSVFIFQAGSSLITGPNSRVELVNGASPCNVFWQVGSSATLDTNTTFVGTIMALTSVSLNDTATVQGRVMARNGAVTLINNTITTPNCPVPPTGDNDNDNDGNDDDNNGNPPVTDRPDSPVTSGNDNPTTTTPVVPSGNPKTGLGGAAQANDDSTSIIVALAALGSLGAAGLLLAARRRNVPKA